MVSSETKLNKMILSGYLYTLLDALLEVTALDNRSAKNKGQRDFPSVPYHPTCFACLSKKYEITPQTQKTI